MAGRCVICGATDRLAPQRIVGLGTICIKCGAEPVECGSCGRRAKRMTMTYLRGHPLCLECYARERKKGSKRLSMEIDASYSDVSEAAKKAVDLTPQGYVLIALKISETNKNRWVAEYEREDLFQMRCG